MRAVGYLREIPEAPTTLRLERQRRTFLLACADAGLEAGATVTDLIAAPGQPAFRHMLAAARAEGRRGATALIVASVAVLGDSARDQWLRALQAGAAGLALRIAGARDLDAALLAAWAARGASERRRERSLEGMRRRAVRGEVLGRPPFGYRVERAPVVGGGRSRLVPDPAEAPTVRRIFASYLEAGEGVRRIAAALNADGVRTRRGGAWSIAAVRGVLRNPVYTGLYRRLGITIPGAHEALVTRADFGAVQRRLAARRTSRGGPRRHDYPLSAVARCGYCGAPLVGGSRALAAGAARTYRCGAAVNQGRCRAHARRADALEDEVLAAVVSGAPRAPVLTGAASPAPGAVAEEQPARDRALRRTLDRLIERHAGGEWTFDELQRRAAPAALELLDREERAAAPPPADDAPDDAAAAGAGGPESPGDAGPPASVRDAGRRRLVAGWDVLDEAARRALLIAVVREVIVTDDDVRVALAP
jgi:DNA invertase Pin-like site-specific DNA recombinase